MGRRKLSHVGRRGGVKMVNVAAKGATQRWARAGGTVQLGPAIAAVLRQTGATAKGHVFDTARIAGILAAKQTAALIPLCHPLALDVVDLELTLAGDVVKIESYAACDGKTGVEMEALTAVAVAALTVYDMCKSLGKEIEISSIRLLEKGGGRSGHWKRPSAGGCSRRTAQKSAPPQMRTGKKSP
ncbi:MAG: cyclic pyranopterin monophosphate synthase MoaC [Candidatus Sumerlaeia bacterium]|nr:cyclic pyranopterin monophosphate synthase MoaC [Candidatus Sumerlaeia bacterium]